MPKSCSKYNWYVICGGPCSGKTTVINELAKLGYAVCPEMARVLIDKEIAEGKSLKMIRGDEEEFQTKVLRMKIELERTIPEDKVVFFDRGMPDSVAYCHFYGFDAGEAIKSCQEKKYAKIFFLEQLPFQRDYARIGSDDDAKKLSEFLRESYQNLGYNLIIVPAVPVSERLKIILSEVGKI